jgi:uncharacterized RDD family membrane protein YckC
MEQQTANILLDIEQDLSLERASVGARFANFLIDLVFYYIVWFGMLALLMISIRQDTGDSFFLREDKGSVLLQYLLSITSFLTFFTIVEGASNGKTLGKLVTGTRAQKMDGSRLTWKDAFLRSVCRLVPFEAFSAFGGLPWHDKWTDTIVTKDVK